MLTHRAMPQSHHLLSSRLSRPRGEMPSFGDPALQTVSFIEIAAGLPVRAVRACYDGGPPFHGETRSIDVASHPRFAKEDQLGMRNSG